MDLTIPCFLREMAALYIAAAMNGLQVAFATVVAQSLAEILSAPHARTKNFSNFSLVEPTLFGSAFGLFPVFWINALMMGAGGGLGLPRTRDRSRKT